MQENDDGEKSKASGTMRLKGFKRIYFFSPFYLNFKDSGDTRMFHSLSLPKGVLSLRCTVLGGFSYNTDIDCFNYCSYHLSITLCSL